MSGVAAALSATQQIRSQLHLVPEIERRLQDIADELDLNSRGANTYRTYDFDREISLSDLNDVDFAMDRLEKGTYFSDEITGAPLQTDFLTANPIARRNK